MRNSAMLCVVIAALGGCGDNDDPSDDFGGEQDNGMDGDGDGDGDGMPGVMQWSTLFTGTEQYSELAGTATVRQTMGAQSFDASASVRNDQPGAVRPWHVHIGTCATGGPIVGEEMAYPRLIIGDDGSSEQSVTVEVPLDLSLEYHVNVHLSPTELNTIIACGDLIRR